MNYSIKIGKFELLPDTEVATTDQILPLVKNELGLGFVPELMAQEALSKREIVKISLKKRFLKEMCVWYMITSIL